MRGYYLSKSLASEHDVDLIAQIQPNLITPFFENLEVGITQSYEHLGSIFDSVSFAEMDCGNSTLAKLLLAVKCIFRKIPYSVAWHSSSQFDELLKKKLQETKYDLIHIDTLGLCQFLPSNINIPVSIDHHNIESSMMQRRSKKSTNVFKKVYFYLEYLKIRKYEDTYCPNADFQITCSKSDSADLLSRYPKISVLDIPNPVPRVLHNRPRKPHQENPTALFIGGLDWYPNADAISHFVYELFPKIQKSNANLQIDIIGKNPSKKLVDKCLDNPQITIHGYVDDIRDFYQKSSLFICPIRDGGGTKLKVIDAMMNEQAVIGYPEAFEGLDVTDGVNAIICKSESEFISKFCSYIGDLQEIISIGKSARKYAESSHADDLVGTKLIKYYSGSM